MSIAGRGPVGRIATWLASSFAPPYKARAYLAKYNPRGFASPSARFHIRDIRLGSHVFIGDRVIVYQTRRGGYVELGDKVALYSDIIIETDDGGNVKIGAETHIQPRCQLTAAKSSIIIGARVEIAANCAFYPFNHDIRPDLPVRQQGLTTKGDIVIGDDAWLGYGVIVLDGVRIGAGAVIGAGSVVTRDIPPNAVAFGSPARVVRYR